MTKFVAMYASTRPRFIGMFDSFDAAAARVIEHIHNFSEEANTVFEFKVITPNDADIPLQMRYEGSTKCKVFRPDGTIFEMRWSIQKVEIPEE